MSGFKLVGNAYHVSFDIQGQRTVILIVYSIMLLQYFATKLYNLYLDCQETFAAAKRINVTSF